VRQLRVVLYTQDSVMAQVKNPLAGAGPERDDVKRFETDEAKGQSGVAPLYFRIGKLTMATKALSLTARKNVETIAQVEQRVVGRRSRMDRLSDAIARFFGRLRFIVAHAVFLSTWFAINLGFVPAVPSFDPYPFPFLGLVVGIEFIILTTFVLMNQNQQSRREEQWAHLNLQLAMLAEHEVTKNMQMLHTICKHLGLEEPVKDREVSELVQPTPVKTLVDEIAEKLGEANSGPPVEW
jgi:uncharacterized membrane protein